MFRMYQLPISNEVLRTDLNNPEWNMVQKTMSCDPESGTVYVGIRYMPALDRRTITHIRKIESYRMNQGSSTALERIENDPVNRIIEVKQFQTESGTVMVVDYEVRQ